MLTCALLRVIRVLIRSSKQAWCWCLMPCLVSFFITSLSSSVLWNIGLWNESYSWPNEPMTNNISVRLWPLFIPHPWYIVPLTLSLAAEVQLPNSDKSLYLSMFVMVSVVTERQAKWDRLWWICTCDQELYQTGIEAYYDEEWMTAVQNIEQSIPEYFKEYRRCLALCDEPYDQRVFAVFHQQITSSNIASRNKLLLGTDERFCYIALLVNSCQSNVMFNEDKCLRLGLSWLRGQTKARRLRPRLML